MLFFCCEVYNVSPYVNVFIPVGWLVTAIYFSRKHIGYDVFEYAWHSAKCAQAKREASVNTILK